MTGFVFCLLLFVVYMWCPAQGTTGAWVMAGVVLLFPLCEFSLFDTP